MKTAEEILFKYTGWLGNAKMVHYDDALQAMEEFASQFEQSSSEGEDQRKLWEEVEQHIIWHYQEFDIEELQTKFKISRRLSPPKSEQPQEGGQWISVKERLPLTDEYVLITDGIEVWVGNYERSGYRGRSQWGQAYIGCSMVDVTEITHWQPLPKPENK